MNFYNIMNLCVFSKYYFDVEEVRLILTGSIILHCFGKNSKYLHWVIDRSGMAESDAW